MRHKNKTPVQMEIPVTPNPNVTSQHQAAAPVNKQASQTQGTLKDIEKPSQSSELHVWKHDMNTSEMPRSQVCEHITTAGHTSKKFGVHVHPLLTPNRI